MRPNLPPHQGAIGGWAHLRAAVRAMALIVVTVCLSAIQLCALRLSAPLAQYLPRLWHRTSCRFLGLDVSAYGVPAVGGPILYVCNHASYLDVSVLGGIVDARFVAKAEVSRWPIIGALSKLTGTLFIERRAHSVRSQSNELRRVLRIGRQPCPLSGRDEQ